MVKALAVRFALVVSCILATAGLAAPASAAFLQCAPFARQVSGIDIRGNADTWWSQAAGRYERGHAPKVGSVLAFAASHRMRVGHVAMVSKVVSDREVLLTHANWSRPGRVETDVRAVDVSPAGDWTMVRVWYAPQGGLGTSAYATRGFIYSGRAASAAVVADEVRPALATSPAPGIVAASGLVIATAASVSVVAGLPLDR